MNDRSTTDVSLSKSTDRLRLIRLEAENVKRLSAVCIEPNGNVIEITGRNGMGKSSVLDSIYWLLAGKDSIQASPIRDGEEEARIEGDLGAYVVRRKFKKAADGGYTTSVTVENSDGFKAQRPHETLSGLIGSMSFDPVEFSRMKPRDQFDALKAFVPDVDFDEIAQADLQDRDERKDLGRRFKEVVAQANGIYFPDDTPDQAIDESELISKLEDAGRHNADIEARLARRAALSATIESNRASARQTRDRAADLRAQADELDRRASEFDSQARSDQSRLDEAGPLPEPVDPSSITAEITRARNVNAQVAKRQQRNELIAKGERLEAQIAVVDQAIKDREAAKKKAIAEAKMPIAGLGFGDGCILLNGHPFDQASDAEQLRASIAIAMASDPRLRLIRVREGSLLDSGSMALLAEMAEQMDFQVWIETVDSGRPGAIVIEDGRVKNFGDEPAAAAE